MTVDVKKEDKIGRYPKKFDIPSLRNRQIHWTSWFLMVGLTGSMILNIALVAVVFSLFPLKRVEPLLVQFVNKSDLMAQVIPLGDMVSGREVLLEAGVREYVTKRFSFDPSENVLARQWGNRGYIRYASSESVWREFSAQLNANAERIEQLIAEGTRRFVNIVRVTPNPTASNFFDVQFDIVVQNRLGNEIDRQRYYAVVGAEFRPGSVPYEDRLINPTGFTVTAITFREIEE